MGMHLTGHADMSKVDNFRVMLGCERDEFGGYHRGYDSQVVGFHVVENEPLPPAKVCS
jgi:hypothetical protein